MLCPTALRTDEILGSLRHNDEDCDDEHRHRWAYDEAAIFQAYLATGALLNPAFLLPRTATYGTAISRCAAAQPASRSSRGTQGDQQSKIISGRCWFQPSPESSSQVPCCRGVPLRSLVQQGHLRGGRTSVCTPLSVPAPNDSEWALEGLVAQARFRRPVEGDFSHLHDHERVHQPQVRWPTFHLLLTRNLCVKECAPPPRGSLQQGWARNTSATTRHQPRTRSA